MQVTLIRDVATPNVGSSGSAGIDFYIPNDIDKTQLVVRPRSFIKIPLGVKAIVQQDHVLLMQDKSGVVSKLGLHVCAGVVDSDYRGEVHACFINVTDYEVQLNPGDKIIQGVVVKYDSYINVITNKEYETIESIEASNLRGAKGFGNGTAGTYRS